LWWGKLEGKSDRQAALDAGYAPSTAENTKQKIMSRPEAREAFRNCSTSIFRRKNWCDVPLRGWTPRR